MKYHHAITYTWCALLTIWVASTCLSGTARREPVISVQRLNITDAHGNLRMVLADSSRFPLPVINGDTLPRSVAPSGMVFYDNEGNETGGVGLVNVPSGEQTMMIFDYSNSEAVGIGKFESADGALYNAGISIADRGPLGRVGGASVVRIDLYNSQSNCALVMKDRQGRTRLRLMVDSLGEPSIELLDSTGRSLEAMP